jgi:ubiquinone/menaquinone biosynthesis C-methylase UbiE
MILEFSQSANPWFGALYDLYSFAAMPLVGKIMVGSRRAFRYLTESMHLFHTQES